MVMVQSELREYFDSMMVLGRSGKPHDIVGPALLLASVAGGYIIGYLSALIGKWGKQIGRDKDGFIRR